MGIKECAKAVIDFFRETDFEVSMKQDNMTGKVVKEGSGFTLGVGQDSSDTEFNYKDKKVKVTHTTECMPKENHDTESG